MPRYELIADSSAKFWDLRVKGSDVIVNYGRIGSSGQTKTKSHGSPAAAKEAAAKLTSSKVKKGYVKVQKSGVKKIAKKVPSKSTAEKSIAKKSTASKSTASKSTAKKSTAKKSTAKKSTAKKSTAKKSTAKKSTAKKSTAKKSTAKKSTAKKSTASKSTASKSTAKKSTASKSTAKKSTASKSTAKKSTAKKSTAKKSTASKSTARKSTAKKPPGIKKAIELIQRPREKQHQDGIDALRDAVKKQKNIEACSWLLWHLSSQFQTGRYTLDAEFASLTKLLASKGKAKKELGRAYFAQALMAFDKHGAKKANYCQRLLADASKKHKWYKNVPHFFEPNGIDEAVCELEAGKGARLFYLMLSEFQRHNWDKPANPWLLGAIKHPKFWPWLNQQKKIPKLPSGMKVELSELTKEVAGIYRNDFRLRYWPTGRREILAAVGLLAGTRRLAVDEALVNMSSINETDAIEFLCKRGVSAKGLASAAKTAAIHGWPDIFSMLKKFGATQAHFSGALQTLCSEGANMWASETEGEVIDTLIGLGAKANLDKALTKFWYHTGRIEALLRHGADPIAVKKEILESNDPSLKALFAEYITVAKPKKQHGISSGEARTWLDAHATKLGLSAGELRKIRTMLKKKSSDTLVETSWDEPMLLARGLFRAGDKSPRKKSKLLLKKAEVIEGPLVAKNLIVTAHVLVLGDLEADDLDIDETGLLIVAGDLRTRSLHCGGRLVVGGSIDTPLIYGFDCGTVEAAKVHCDLTIMHMYCDVKAKSFKGEKFLLESSCLDDKAYIAAENKIPKNCLSKNPSYGVGRIDFQKLSKAALKGKPVVR